MIILLYHDLVGMKEQNQLFSLLKHPSLNKTGPNARKIPVKKVSLTGIFEVLLPLNLAPNTIKNIFGSIFHFVTEFRQAVLGFVGEIIHLFLPLGILF